MIPYVLIRGGGDLASGAVLRLHRVGILVLVVEKPQPLAVRRSVAFAQAVYDGEVNVEDVSGQLIQYPAEMLKCWQSGRVPVLVDPDLKVCEKYPPVVLVDATMLKNEDPISLNTVAFVVGLGPGFEVGTNCHAAVETNRGHFLGRVYWSGSTEADTGIPEKVGEYARERVLYAPVDGDVATCLEIGDIVKAGDLVLSVSGHEVRAPFPGIVRGLIQTGVYVNAGTKVGDIDPRLEAFRCWTVSEKSLAIGGGVLEAILTRSTVRAQLWQES